MSRNTNLHFGFRTDSGRKCTNWRLKFSLKIKKRTRPKYYKFQSLNIYFFSWKRSALDNRISIEWIRKSIDYFLHDIRIKFLYKNFVFLKIKKSVWKTTTMASRHSQCFLIFFFFCTKRIFLFPLLLYPTLLYRRNVRNKNGDCTRTFRWC